MKLSLSSFVFLNYPLDQAISRIADAGYDGVDIWGGRPHAYRSDLTAGEIRELAGRIRDLGLSVPSFIPAQFRYPTCLCSPKEKVRKDSIGYIKESLETAAGLGAPVVSVCPGHSVYGQDRGTRSVASPRAWGISARRPVVLTCASRSNRPTSMKRTSSTRAPKRSS